MPHVQREKQFSRVLCSSGPFLSCHLLFSCYFPVSGRYTQDKERETYGSLQHHISIHFYETASYKQRNICFTRLIFQDKKFSSTNFYVYVTESLHAAQCMIYRQRVDDRKSQQKIFRIILNVSTIIDPLFKMQQYQFLF